MKEHCKRILIVEDNKSTAMMYESLIKKFFPEVEMEFVYDAETATKRIYQNNFNLAILDVELGDPDTNGLDLARLCFLFGKPAIICTASNIFTKMKFGMDNRDIKKNSEYITKPFNADKFITAIQNLIDKKIDPIEITIALSKKV